MKELEIKFENCYGIGKFDTKFDFGKRNIFVIYAPNGTMKTSFANTFKVISEGGKPEDRVHKDKVTKCVIRDDGAAIREDKIFVVVPMDTTFKSERISTLLVNSKLKVEYDSICTAIDEKKEALISALKTLSGLPKKDIESTLAFDIANDPKEFFDALERKRVAIKDRRKLNLINIPYQTIFNDKVVALIESGDFEAKLADYMKIYDDLITGSRFFRRGIFNHDNATDIARNLADNGFFEAQHSINMKAPKGASPQEIKTQAELEKVIEEEKERILKDPKLARSFGAINDRLKKNEDTRKFRRLLEANMALLGELNNLRSLKDKLWTDYLINSSEQYNALMDVYDKAKAKINDIFDRARKEKTKWRKVIDEFNRRFAVPFTVIMENQEDVILKEQAPSLRFDHTGKTIQEKFLWDILSMGERRALYLLNIIFEVQGRIEEKKETLFIIDDIADSFDYKNKYAIIEYLSEMATENSFYQIILTHNFDFYRTIVSRLDVAQNKFFIEKSDSANVVLVEDRYYTSPFIIWKKNLASNDEMLVASIPLVRNLLQYCGGSAVDLTKLTALLHYKSTTDSMTIADIEQIFKNVLKDMADLYNKGRNVKKLIYELADAISTSTSEVIELEKKIVLSIAIRMRAEEFMVNKISDNAFWGSISKNQTLKLIKKYKDKYATLASEEATIRVLDRVNLITPENIHLNSFMYEPILDMSNNNLTGLYKDTCALK